MKRTLVVTAFVLLGSSAVLGCLPGANCACKDHRVPVQTWRGEDAVVDEFHPLLYERCHPRAGATGRQVSGRDKTGTNGCPVLEAISQHHTGKELATARSFEAEGKGVEPSTGCPAPDFESGR